MSEGREEQQKEENIKETEPEPEVAVEVGVEEAALEEILEEESLDYEFPLSEQSSEAETEKLIRFEIDKKRKRIKETSPVTVYESMYETLILSQWKDDNKRSKSRIPSSKPNYKMVKDITIALNDENAEEGLDLSRIGWKGRLEYAIQEGEDQKGRYVAKKHEIAYNPNKLLEIATATIILMAKRSSKVPPQNYMYTEIYLRSIKNENGDNPPNIKNLLKHIRYLKHKHNIDWGAVVEQQAPNNLTIVKISKQSKIPIRVNTNISNVSEYDQRMNNVKETFTIKTDKQENTIGSDHADNFDLYSLTGSTDTRASRKRDSLRIRIEPAILY